MKAKPLLQTKQLPPLASFNCPHVFDSTHAAVPRRSDICFYHKANYCASLVSSPMPTASRSWHDQMQLLSRCNGGGGGGGGGGHSGPLRTLDCVCVLILLLFRY